MNRKKYVLWIEDEGAYNLAQYATPVAMHPSYDLTLATTISDAVRFLTQQEYQVIVVDLRNLPGTDQNWINLYNQLARNGGPVQLGLHLLLNLFGKPKNGYDVQIEYNNIIKRNIDILRYCILSVDPFQGEIEYALKRIGFSPEYYEQKRANMTKNVLLELIQKRLEQK